VAEEPRKRPSCPGAGLLVLRLPWMLAENIKTLSLIGLLPKF